MGLLFVRNEAHKFCPHRDVELKLTVNGRADHLALALDTSHRHAGMLSDGDDRHVRRAGLLQHFGGYLVNELLLNLELVRVEMRDGQIRRDDSAEVERDEQYFKLPRLRRSLRPLRLRILRGHRFR